MALLSADVADKALALLVADLKIPGDERSTTKNPVDRAAREANELELLLIAFQDHVKKRILALRREHNRVVPIHCLPPEILVQIFLDVIEDPGIKYSGHHGLVVSLALVCTSWYPICMSAPRLWSHLSTGTNLEITKLRIERSKHVPLHIQCHRHNKGKDREAQFLEMVVPHMSRWKSFSISSDHIGELTSTYLSKKCMPILECLTINAGATLVSAMHTVVPLSISAPSLRVIDALYFPCPLHLESGLHFNLRSIKMTPGTNGAIFLLEHYRLLLSSSPYLEHIEIEGDFDDPPPTSQADRTFNAQLHSLKTVNFYYLPWNVISTLLSSISTVSTQNPLLSIRVTPLPHLVPVVFPHVTGLHTILETIRTSEWLTIRRRTNLSDMVFLGIHLGIGEKPDKKELLHLELERYIVDAGEMLSQFMESGYFTKVRRVDVEGVQVFANGEIPWSDASLPSLETLRIRSDYVRLGEENLDSLHQMINNLSSPISSRTWPCPRLRHITFYCSVDSKWLLMLLKARGRKVNSWTTPSVGKSSTLEVVEISEKNKEALKPWQKKLDSFATKYNVKLLYHKPTRW